MWYLGLLEYHVSAAVPEVEDTFYSFIRRRPFSLNVSPNAHTTPPLLYGNLSLSHSIRKLYLSSVTRI